MANNPEDFNQKIASLEKVLSKHRLGVTPPLSKNMVIAIGVAIPIIILIALWLVTPKSLIKSDGRRDYKNIIWITIISGFLVGVILVIYLHLRRND